MGGFNFIFCVAENFIKTVGFDFIVSNANDFIKNSESSTLSTKNIKTSFLYPTDKNRQASTELVGFIFTENSNTDQKRRGLKHSQKKVL